MSLAAFAPVPKPTASPVVLTRAQNKAMDVLISDATHCAVYGGSRSGKTFLLVRAVIIRSLKCKSRHVIFRFRFNSAKQAIVLETMPQVLDQCFPGLRDNIKLDKTDWFYTFPNGSEIWIGGLDDNERVEKILGKEYATIYFNECSNIPYHSVTTAHSRLAQKTESLRLKCYYDFNPPSKQHWTYRVFYEKRDPFSRSPLKHQNDYGFYIMNPMDNKENLDPKYIEILEAMPTRKRNRFLFGLFADDADGLLWTDTTLDSTRVLNEDDTPEMLRIVVAVDPSGCTGPEDLRSDEIGITVCGLGTDGHGYLIDDLSGRYGPAQWGQIVRDAYERYKADRIIGEKNYGGAMVEHTIQSVDSSLPFSYVTATRGKIIRAEPIASLWEQGRIHCTKYFPELEEQLCGMTLAGYTGIKSPDRADSAIWGFTELFSAMVKPESKRNWQTPTVNRAPRSASRFSRSSRR